jgi:hypothetical protein
MRTAIAWIVGIITFLAVGLGLAFLGDALGVSISIDLDRPTTITHGSGPYSYDEEVTSLTTSYGYTSGVFAFLIGLWTGQAVYVQHWNAGFTKKGWYSFFAWLIALTALMVVSVLVHLAFRSFNSAFASYIRMFIELGAVLGIGWACHQWFKNRVKYLEYNPKP